MSVKREFDKLAIKNIDEVSILKKRVKAQEARIQELEVLIQKLKQKVEVIVGVYF